MTYTENDIRFMRRALQLAANGQGQVSPNPMVGAVIVDAAGNIIGEGWHRHFGGPHAEVNAVRSVPVSCRHLLADSTIYVTLEPCSHYGKTPPCAKLLVETGIRRCVVGAGDPNPKVSGRGISMLRDAGIEVTEHVLEDECVALNRTFMFSQTYRRPFVTLKWAVSKDGFMDYRRDNNTPPAVFSNSQGAQIVHWRRAGHDAIAVGATTVLADNPRLDVRHICGRNPRPVVFDRHSLLSGHNHSLCDNPELISITEDKPLSDTLNYLFSNEGVSSLLVEGGASLLRSFIDSGLWEEAFVEVAPLTLGAAGRVPSPVMPHVPDFVEKHGLNMLLHYTRMV